MQDQSDTWVDLVKLSPGVKVILLQTASVDTPGNIGLIESLDQYTTCLGIPVNQSLDCDQCSVNSVCLLPFDRAPAPTVIESVLRARCCKGISNDSHQLPFVFQFGTYLHANRQ